MQQIRERFLSLFSHSPEVLAFVQTFCNTNEETTELSNFCIQILYDCICEDKLDLLPSYMGIYDHLKKFTSPPTSSQSSLYGLAIACILEIYRQHQLHHQTDDFLIDGKFLDYVKGVVDEYFTTMATQYFSTISEFVRTGVFPLDTPARTCSIISSYAAFKRWPDSRLYPEIERAAVASKTTNPHTLCILLSHQFPGVDLNFVKFLLRS